MVGLMAGAVACSGAGAADESTDAGDGTEVTPVCAGESCCVPVVVDREAFRVYRVDDELYFDVFARTAGEPSVESTYWSLESEVSGDMIDPLVCEPQASYELTRRAYDACRTPPRRMPACGATVRLEVRLASSVFNELAVEVCTAVGYGPSTTVEAIVECPVCPEPVRNFTPCEFPRAGSCPYPTFNPYSMRPETLSCRCGGVLSDDAPRSWSCPIY
jgi:hypothetical protein